MLLPPVPSVSKSTSPLIRTRGAVGLALALVFPSLTASTAQAQGVQGVSLDGLFAPVGLNLGYATDRRGGSFLLGAELSYVRSWETPRTAVWLGGYTDVRWAPALDLVRLGVGPEVGIAAVTLDFGYVLEVRDGRAAHGFELRGLLSLALVHPYVRAGFGPDLPTYVEAGALLKYPFAVERPRHRRDSTPPAVGESSETDSAADGQHE